MRPLELEGVQVDLCPLCLGFWFDAGELSRAAGVAFDTAATGRALSQARRTARRCPLCAKPLYERPLDPHSDVLVEQCPQCSGLFLDQGEFARARDFFRASGAPELPGRPTARSSAPPVLDPDSTGLVLFQILTGLPVEVDTLQTVFPPVVTALIVANVVVFLLTRFSGFESWIGSLALVPSEVWAGRRLYMLVTSVFMHAGLFHLLGNMYFLYIAGDNVEERFGPWKFLAFYLAGGIAAGLADAASRPGSMVPAVGASGAISGVLGAYVILFPYNRFLVRWLWGFWPMRFEMPAYAYLGLWVLFQLLAASLEAPGVAWWAHICGFACGAGTALAVRLAERRGSAGGAPAA
jgi:membrane associated rhomboid family serine protease